MALAGNNRDELRSLEVTWGSAPRKIAIIPTLFDRERDPSTCVGELMAITYSFSVLRELHREHDVCIVDPRRWEDDNFSLGDKDFRTFISLGSCLFNKFEERAHGPQGSNQYFTLTDDENHAVRLGPNNTPWETKYRNGMHLQRGGIVTDYGVIVWRNENNKRYVYCIGAHTYGTLASAAYVFTPQFSSWYVKQGCPTSFQLLVRIDQLDQFHDDLSTDSGQKHPVDIIEGLIGTTIVGSLPERAYNRFSLQSFAAGMFGEHYINLKAHSRIMQMTATYFFVAIILVFLLALLSQILQ